MHTPRSSPARHGGGEADPERTPLSPHYLVRKPLPSHQKIRARIESQALESRLGAPQSAALSPSLDPHAIRALKLLLRARPASQGDETNQPQITRVGPGPDTLLLLRASTFQLVPKPYCPQLRVIWSKPCHERSTESILPIPNNLHLLCGCTFPLPRPSAQ